MTTLFVTGIDTDIGKTVACGVLAKTMLARGLSVYTQKLVETGCIDGESNDLFAHEQIVGKSFNFSTPELHCPYRFITPASPHLAAERDNRRVDSDFLAQQMTLLAQQCDHLLVEGAGGLCVPLNQEKMIIDFIDEQKLPVVLVTSPRLGSINHTLLSLSLCLTKSIDVRAIIYNHYPDVDDWLVKDTKAVLQEKLKRSYPKILWLDLHNKKQNFVIEASQWAKLLGLVPLKT